MNLTREQILAMPAGRELDILVQWHVIQGGKMPSNTYVPHAYLVQGPETIESTMDLKRYSTDIACAWLVVEKMRLEGSMPELTSGEPNDDWQCWTCLTSAFADTAPLAICRAALLSTL